VGRARRQEATYSGTVSIKKTNQSDLPKLMQLWNNGEVMFYISLPRRLEGINRDAFS